MERVKEPAHVRNNQPGKLLCWMPMSLFISLSHRCTIALEEECNLDKQQSEKGSLHAKSEIVCKYLSS